MNTEQATWSEFLSRLASQDAGLTRYHAQASVNDHDLYVAMSSLATNRTLTNLYLQGCRDLTDHAAICLAVALSSNNTLVHLDMRNTHITERGRTSLANSRGGGWKCCISGQEGQVFRWTGDRKRPTTTPAPSRLAWGPEADLWTSSRDAVWSRTLPAGRGFLDEQHKHPHLPRACSAAQLCGHYAAEKHRPSSQCSTSAADISGLRSVSAPGSPVSDYSPSPQASSFDWVESRASTPQQPVSLMRTGTAPHRGGAQRRSDSEKHATVRISESLPALPPKGWCSR